MRKIFKLLIVVILFAMVGCKLFESHTTDMEPIEGNVLFTMTLDSTGNDAGFLILMKTEKTYPCFNFEIETSMTINQDIINVQLHGVSRPDICLTAFGPAWSRIPLDISDGAYELIFSYQENKDKYLVALDDRKITVTKVDTSFTRYRVFNNGF